MENIPAFTYMVSQRFTYGNCNYKYLWYQHTKPVQYEPVQFKLFLLYYSIMIVKNCIAELCQDLFSVLFEKLFNIQK